MSMRAMEQRVGVLLERVHELNARPVPVLERVGVGVVRCRGCGWQGVPSGRSCPSCVEAPATDLLWELERLERAIHRETAVRRPRAPEQRVVRQAVGRNDPCPCGSGRKWKRCCA